MKYKTRVTIEVVYSIFINAILSTITGFGTYFIYYLGHHSVWVSMLAGMLMSAIMMVVLFPYKKVFKHPFLWGGV